MSKRYFFEVVLDVVPIEPFNGFLDDGAHRYTPGLAYFAQNVFVEVSHRANEV
jgi:hypothetical protein